MGKIIVKETANKSQGDSEVGLEKVMGDKKDELVAVPIDQEVAETGDEGTASNSELAKSAKIIDVPEEKSVKVEPETKKKAEKKPEAKAGVKKVSKLAKSIAVTEEKEPDEKKTESVVLPAKILGITETADNGRITEAEKISGVADVLSGEVAVSKKTNESLAKKPVAKTLSVPKAQVVGGKAGPKSMSGMVMDATVRSNMSKNSNNKNADSEISDDDLDAMLGGRARTDSKAKKTLAAGEPRFSKPKATLIAVAVALVVGLIGGVIVWLMGRGEVQYCTVQFESNGGSNIDSEEVVCGQTVLQPADPTKEGFDFVGWVYSGSAFNFDATTIDEDMILVAKWKAHENTEIVTVTFDTDGGSEIEPLEVAKGKITSAPIAPTKDGYTFVEWQKDGEKFEFPAIIDENIVLVAKWEKTQTPTTNNGGGSSNGNSNGGGSGSSNTETKATGLTIGDREVEVNRSAEFVVSVTPSGAKINLEIAGNINSSVADCMVSNASQGRLSCAAKNSGTTTITVRDTISGKTAQFRLTVKASEPTTVPVSSVTVSCSATTLEEGAGTSCSASVLPTNATNKNVVWSSSDTGVVTVNANGGIMAVGAGMATITATVDGKTGSVTITVNAKAPEPSEEEKCNSEGGTWENGVCNKDTGGETE